MMMFCPSAMCLHQLLTQPLLCRCCFARCLLKATDVLRGSGSLSAERKQYLEELRTQLNLTKETGDKILR
jgi:hypothetical protein